MKAEFTNGEFRDFSGTEPGKIIDELVADERLIKQLHFDDHETGRLTLHAVAEVR